VVTTTKATRRWILDRVSAPEVTTTKATRRWILGRVSAPEQWCG